LEYNLQNNFYQNNIKKHFQELNRIASKGILKFSSKFPSLSLPLHNQLLAVGSHNDDDLTVEMPHQQGQQRCPYRTGRLSRFPADFAVVG